MEFDVAAEGAASKAESKDDAGQSLRQELASFVETYRRATHAIGMPHFGERTTGKNGDECLLYELPGRTIRMYKDRIEDNGSVSVFSKGPLDELRRPEEVMGRYDEVVPAANAIQAEMGNWMMQLFTSMDSISGFEADESETLTDKYQRFSRTISRLEAALGIDDSTETQKEKKPRAPKRKGRARMASVAMANDQISRAVFERGSSSGSKSPKFTLDDILEGRPLDIPTAKPSTGRKVTASLGITNQAFFDLDDITEENYSEYEAAIMPTFACSLVHGAIGSVIMSRKGDGPQRIWDVDIAEALGFKNGLKDKSSSETAAEILAMVFRMRNVGVAFDASKDCIRKTGGIETDVARAAREKTFKSLISCDVTVLDEDESQGLPGEMARTDGEQCRVRWYLDTLPVMGGDPITALPLYAYAESKNMLVSIGNLEFRQRVGLLHKAMWAYIVRRINERGTSNTVSLETMFGEIGPGRDRNWQNRMKNKLEKMLEEREADGVLLYSFDLSKKTVTIEPKSDSGLIK